mmetsp:Transcript_8752/g.13052  ORF Transcript_8752/g.13052 Transcript_8752/m.13052 type:complete len:237 (+) Transcript_8752:4436-5146(+)
MSKVPKTMASPSIATPQKQTSRHTSNSLLKHRSQHYVMPTGVPKMQASPQVPPSHHYLSSSQGQYPVFLYGTMAHYIGYLNVKPSQHDPVQRVKYMLQMNVPNAFYTWDTSRRPSRFRIRSWHLLLLSTMTTMPVSAGHTTSPPKASVISKLEKMQSGNPSKITQLISNILPEILTYLTCLPKRTKTQPISSNFVICFSQSLLQFLTPPLPNPPITKGYTMAKMRGVLVCPYVLRT